MSPLHTCASQMAATGHTRHNNTTQQNTHRQHNKHTSTRLISLGPAQLHEMKIVPLQSKEGQKGVDNEQLKKRKHTSAKGSLEHSEKQAVQAIVSWGAHWDTIGKSGTGTHGVLCHGSVNFHGAKRIG